MKYPQAQFTQLVEHLKTLAVHFELNSVHPATLHYEVYKNGSEGQKHNWLYLTKDGAIKRAHGLLESEIETATKILDVNPSFELYPTGINDDHILTAMKNAFKMI